MWKSFSVLIIFLAIGVGYYSFWPDEQEQAADIPVEKAVLKPDDATLVARGKLIYGEYCASCHGENLEGQPDWRQRGEDGLLPAPPHDASGHTWHHADKDLFAITKFGLAEIIGMPDYQTAMPAYDEMLSDMEIIAVLSFIKSTWPERERAFQDNLNAASAETS